MQIVLSAENIGETIRAIRLEKNMLQADLAKQCGISESTLRRIECGYGHIPSADKVISIFNALGKKVVLK